METLGKIVRGLASIPIIGGALVFVLGFFPLLAIVPLNLSNGLSLILGGLLMAAWCYFLNVKKIINIVTPLIPIPLWILGIVMALAGVYGMVTNKWDDGKDGAETVPQEITPLKSVSEPDLQLKQGQDQMPLSKSGAVDPVDVSSANKIQEANSIDLEKMKDEASEKALVHLEQALKNMEELSESIGQEKLDEIINAQGDEGSDNAMNIEEAMNEMRKQIAELKS